MNARNPVNLFHSRARVRMKEITRPLPICACGRHLLGRNKPCYRHKTSGKLGMLA